MNIKIFAIKIAFQTVLCFYPNPFKNNLNTDKVVRTNELMDLCTSRALTLILQIANA